MPVYEYQCEKCQRKLEVTVHLEEKELLCRTCPFCKQEQALKKIVSKSTFILKGSGWTSKHKE